MPYFPCVDQVTQVFHALELFQALRHPERPVANARLCVPFRQLPEPIQAEITDAVLGLYEAMARCDQVLPPLPPPDPTTAPGGSPPSRPLGTILH